MLIFKIHAAMKSLSIVLINTGKTEYVTFGKMAARAAVRDVARVLEEVPYAEADRLAKMVPPPAQGHHIPLSKSIVEDPDLKREYRSSPVAKQI